MTDYGEPWTYDEMKLTDSRGKIVAYVNHDEAIRGHVLRLVNSWPALIEVLEAAEELMDFCGPTMTDYREAQVSARPRLASALAAFKAMGKNTDGAKHS